MRKILIPLSGRYDPEDLEDLDLPALRMGFNAARRFEAHAEVLCVIGELSKPDERWSALMPGYGAHELIEWMEREGEARHQRARAAYEKMLAACDPAPAKLAAPGPGFSTSFVERTGEIGQTVGERGRLSDVIVIASSKARWAMPFRPILEASLRRTGCPVLVSPIRVPSTFATRIAIAWNDTVESARAVSASLGLLKGAESVLVISCKESDAVSTRPESLIDYLAWHDIAAERVELVKAPRQAGPAIVGEARARGYDLLVLGAYVHTRAHSLLFGSMTEHVLGEPKVPALLVP